MGFVWFCMATKLNMGSQKKFLEEMLLVQTFAFNKVILLFPFLKYKLSPTWPTSADICGPIFSPSRSPSQPCLRCFGWLPRLFISFPNGWVLANQRAPSLPAPWKHARLGLVHGSHRSFWEDFVPYARDEFRFCHLKVKPSARKKGLAFFRLPLFTVAASWSVGKVDAGPKLLFLSFPH